MRYQTMPAAQFIQARQLLKARFPSGAIAVVNANDIPVTNSDGTLRFRQNSDFFWLTGVDQEESILLLAPDFPDPRYREVLFVRETNETIAVWEGHKLTKEEAREASGINTVAWTSEFPRIFQLVMLTGAVSRVFLNANEHYRADSPVESREMRFVKSCQQQFPLHTYDRLAPMMHELRSVKSAMEIEWLCKAVEITRKGFIRVLGMIKPGIQEYEIEAELAHEFLRNGSRGFAYEPIIASGSNSCVLHYIDNSSICNDGDVLLLDIGAEYGNYNADLTRTIPVNGRFTPRQRAIYDAVLHVLQEAMGMLRPGVLYYEYHREVQKVMEAELVKLGLIQKADLGANDATNSAVFQYFMHGTGHQLGLDVHDVGSMYQPMRAGQVWTVEPGIYIREEGIGIRLENNVVIGEDGVTDLMAAFPILPDEIESLMNT